jgi:hypothetical protein
MMAGVASEVVDYLLFIDETKLTGQVAADPLRGAVLGSRAARSQGRSLRESRPDSRS